MRNTVTLILGNANTGKSSLAKRLAEGWNHVYVPENRFMKVDALWNVPVDNKTELIIIDGFRSVEHAKFLIYTNTLEVHQQGKPDIKIIRPSLIIISNHFTNEEFTMERWLTVIHLDSALPFTKNVKQIS